MNRQYFKIILICLIFLALASITKAITIDSCGLTINSTGSYDLTGDISGTTTCITIGGSDVVFDCQGYSIRYGTGGGASTNGIRILNASMDLTNITVKNCIMDRSSTAAASNYGVSITRANNSLIYNNTITTNGTTNNYPIYILNSSNNIISSNNLNAVGSAGTNVGIYLDRVSDNNFTSNVITTTGTTLNYGIFLTGTSTFAANNNQFNSNTITTGGTGISNHGIYITTNSSQNIVLYNNINVISSGTSYGIYTLGVAGFASSVNDTTISWNNITTSNNGSNKGIFISTDSNYNNITNNILNVTGTTANYGIQMLGVLTGFSLYNIIQDNTIVVNGTSPTSATDYGIFGTAMVSNNIIDRNTVKVYGSTTGYPIYITGAATTPSFYNTVTNNNLYAVGTGASNYGVYMLTNVGGFNISNNYIETYGTTLNHGILTTGTAGNGPDNNTITYNTVRTSGSGISNHGIYVTTNHYNNTISNNDIIANGSATIYGLYVVGAANANIANSTFSNNNITVKALTAGSSTGALFSSNILQNNITDNRIEVYGTTINTGMNIIGTAAMPVSNNIVTRNYIFSNNSAVAAATSYGLELSANANYNTISYNNITTVGFTTNYGIYLLDATATFSQYNLIDNNIINATGGGATNHGIFMTTYWYNGNITNNIIYNTGTTGCFGINLVGAVDATRPYNNNTLIENNTIRTTGTTTAYGILLQTNSQNNIVRKNNVLVKSGTTPTGMYISGAASANSDSNRIDSNNFTSIGTNVVSAAYGSLLTSGVNRNQIANNTFYVEGTSINYGVQLVSTALLSLTLNNLENNTIIVNSTGAGVTDYGVYLFTNTQNNTIKNNNITVYGNVTTYGVYLSGATYPSAKNNVINNIINVINSTSTGNTNYGIYLLTNANQNNISYNNITVTGRTTDTGVYVSASSSNDIKNNRISVSGTLNTSNGIYLVGDSQTNTIKDNTVTDVDGDAIIFLTSGYAPENNIIQNNSLNNVALSNLYFESVDINSNHFINQPIAIFNFTGLGSNGVIFEYTNFGKITFTNRINNSGINLSNHIQFANNYILINDTNGLNKSANIIFYNISYQSPVVNLDGAQCPTDYCGNLTNLGNGNFSLTVIGGGTFTLSEIDVNVTLNYPSNNSYFDRTSSINLNYSFIRQNNVSNITAWLYGDGNLLNTSYSITNNTQLIYTWNNLQIGIHNWSIVTNDGSNNNFTTNSSYFNTLNLTIACEAGGPYSQDSLVLISGNISNGLSGMENIQVNASIYREGILNQSHNISSSSDGNFLTSFSNLIAGNYSLNSSISYHGINKNCTDTFFVGSNALLSTDKIISLSDLNSTHISYNITLKITNRGGGTANSVLLTDTDSVSSPYNIGSLVSENQSSVSYIKSYSRNSTNYNVTLAIAAVNGTDSFGGSAISANSSQIIITVPATSANASLVLTKNIYFNSENSTTTNYTVSINVVNSGGTNIALITVLDSDLNLNTLINLSREESYNYSSTILVNKAASNTEKLFVKSTATADTITYQSNQINIVVPGWGGPADTIVYAPASVLPSTSFDTTIEVINQNTDIGQNFVVDYWITNEAETINYSAGQQTIYVSALGSIDLNATLTSPSVAGNYRFRALTSYIGGPDIAFDTFAVNETPVTPGGGTGGTGGAGGGSGGGGGSAAGFVSETPSAPEEQAPVETPSQETIPAGLATKEIDSNNEKIKIETKSLADEKIKMPSQVPHSFFARNYVALLMGALVISVICGLFIIGTSRNKKNPKQHSPKTSHKLSLKKFKNPILIMVTLSILVFGAFYGFSTIKSHLLSDQDVAEIGIIGHSIVKEQSIEEQEIVQQPIFEQMEVVPEEHMEQQTIIEQPIVEKQIAPEKTIINPSLNSPNNYSFIQDPLIRKMIFIAFIVVMLIVLVRGLNLRLTISIGKDSKPVLQEAREENKERNEEVEEEFIAPINRQKQQFRINLPQKIRKPFTESKISLTKFKRYFPETSRNIYSTLRHKYLRPEGNITSIQQKTRSNEINTLEAFGFRVKNNRNHRKENDFRIKIQPQKIEKEISKKSIEKIYSLTKKEENLLRKEEMILQKEITKKDKMLHELKKYFDKENKQSLSNRS